MQNQIVKSIVAVLAGAVGLFILAAGFDWALEKTGYLNVNSFDANTCWIIAVVIVARCVFSLVAAYVTARLAPDRPMLHAMILGSIGVLIGISSMVYLWNKSPHWFLMVLTLIPLPFCWAGGDMYARGEAEHSEMA
jgi:uncharacterized protein YacL